MPPGTSSTRRIGYRRPVLEAGDRVPDVLIWTEPREDARSLRQVLGVDVPLLSDWNGEAARGFGVAVEVSGMSDVAARSAFLIEDGERIRAVWMLGRELPDLDLVIETATRADWTGSRPDHGTG